MQSIIAVCLPLLKEKKGQESRKKRNVSRKRHRPANHVVRIIIKDAFIAYKSGNYDQSQEVF